jgi:hypothetical protein
LDLPFVARIRICGCEVEVLGMDGEAAELGERGFCVRKTEPWFEVCVVLRRVVRRVRNWESGRWLV